MHTLYYSMLIGFMMILGPDTQPYSITADAEFKDTTVSGVGLGRKKKNCGGKGICIIGSDIKIAAIDDQQVIARLSFSNQSLDYMFVSYSDISESAKKEYFSNPYFIMEEAYQETFKAEGKHYKINIPKGKYPISKKRKGLRIKFE